MVLLRWSLRHLDTDGEECECSKSELVLRIIPNCMKGIILRLLKRAKKKLSSLITNEGDRRKKNRYENWTLFYF